jgi:hypothetical protein
MEITTSINVLDWFRDTVGIESDYKLGQLTGIASSHLSDIRAGRKELSDTNTLMLLMIGECKEPLKILAVVEANKAEKRGNDKRAKIWRDAVA